MDKKIISIITTIPIIILIWSKYFESNIIKIIISIYLISIIIINNYYKKE